MNAFDVAIVGCGVHGAAAAFHLASRGVRTVVIERGTPACGPTGRSSAVCRAYYTNEFLATVARDAIAMFEDFASLTGGRDAGFRRTGALFLHPAEDAAQLTEASARLNKLGVVTELLGPDRIAALLPSPVLDGVAIGAWEQNAGYADPSATTIGLYERAVELGARPLLGRRVVAIEPGLVRTDDGERISCGRVLIAAGPWTRALAAGLGVDLPLTVERHIVATFAWSGAPVIPFVLADLVGGFYCKPEGAEQFGLGPLPAGSQCDPDDFAEEVSDGEALSLASAAVARVPGLAEAEPRGGWASLYDVTPDWQPAIGEIAENVFVDAGTSGHGFKLAPALGRHVADMVLGEDVDPGLAQFHPRRFAEGRSIDAGYGQVRILG